MAKLHPGRLKREVGLGGAIMMGLGSMIGTGIFVSIGIAAGMVGPAVVLAILIAALVAACNALSSAQLAASHAVSGGTYEYGYRYLSPVLGFTAGWVFLCAKTASAATAALGFASYALRLTGGSPGLVPVLAVFAVAVFTLLILGGIRRSSSANIIIVSVTLLGLGALLIFGTESLGSSNDSNLIPFFTLGGAPLLSALFHSSALMFVAFAGYARIATLGEEVKDPRRNIPRAIVATLIITALLYVGVALVVLASLGTGGLESVAGGHATPLELAARAMGHPLLARLVAIAAITSMLGVLLNLMLGLSRVVLAMGRQGDMPPVLAQVSPERATPAAAVMLVGLLISTLAFIGSIEIAWSFSAFTVLIYYAITNLAALQLPKEQRLYPKWVAICGMAASLFLAFFVPVPIWAAGVGLILVGLFWKRYVPLLWS